jgi:hypothetical protein
MSKKSPAENSAVDSVPGDEVKTGENLAPVVDEKSNDILPISEPASEPEKIIPLFDVGALSAHAAPSSEAIMPKPETRGRKSKYATQEERDAAKKLQDKIRRAGGTEKATAVLAAAPPMVIPPEAYKFSAEMIVSTMDMVLLAVSDNQYKASDEVRRNYLRAWVNYLETVGKEPPPWVMLIIMSGAYAMPALSTPAGQSKMDKGINKIKAWWVARFGG